MARAGGGRGGSLMLLVVASLPPTPSLPATRAPSPTHSHTHGALTRRHLLNMVILCLVMGAGVAPCQEVLWIIGRFVRRLHLVIYAYIYITMSLLEALIPGFELYW